jgi:hypothetical protein
MSDTMSDIDEPIDPAPGADVESIQELLVKQEAADDADDADEDEVVVPLTKEERLAADPTDSRIVPMQETEFVCKRCFLVKHRSQLADKKRTLCRDCA